MPRSGGAGSYLSNLTQARQRVQQTRRLLGMGERGVQTTNPPLPPQQPPANKGQPQQAPQPTPVPNDRMSALYQQTTEMLRQAKMGQQGATPVAEEPPYRKPDYTQRPVEEALAGVMSTTVRPEIQFFRLAGRPASPRELAIFNLRIDLERRLGRPPTLTEMKMEIGNPPTSPMRPTAFEG
jgi:hypothetical protein